MQAFYPRWIVANGAAEALGLGATFALGFGAAARLEATPGPAGILVGAALAVLFGILCEGVLIGLAQGWVLRSSQPGFPVRVWVLATAAGAGAAWTLGMIPSTVMALLEGPGTAAGSAPPPAEPALAVKLALAALMGALLGPLLAGPQALVLRHYWGRPAFGWLGANALAWAVGMAVIFLGMDLVPWGAGRLPVGAAVLVTCAAAGLVVGAIHGRWLRERLWSRLA